MTGSGVSEKIIRRAERAREVEERLRALQDAHRLAMHGFEEPDDKRLYPIKTLEDMEANEAGNISDLLRNGNPALTSGSLLPSSKLRKSMRLFTPGSAGYLIDLSDVRVVRVDPWDLMSGINRFKKDLRFDQESIDELTNIPSLQELYRLYDAKTFKARTFAKIGM